MSDIQPIPGHVAIVMDGNGRWAKNRNRPRTFGHKQGVETVRAIVSACARRGVKALTLFAFSSENWKRPDQEVSALMDLFVMALKARVDELHQQGVRLRFIGARDALREGLCKEIARAEAKTADNKGMQLVVAANYGGRWDIAQAARRAAESLLAAGQDLSALDPEAVAREVSVADIPEPDLFIRTGGERRISNFLLWQLAYTELYFTDTLWPDFDEEALDLAFQDYAGRQRRFGMTGDQVGEGQGA